jgi:Mn-dependent DtxR family transcriptional regulator
VKLSDKELLELYRQGLTNKIADRLGATQASVHYRLQKLGLRNNYCAEDTVDANGELMRYVIKIDKSESLHLEFEGSEAHHLTENLEAFVDDVVTGRIDRKKLREIPQKVENLEEELGNEIDNIEERLNKSIQHIEDTQKLLHQNQTDISENLAACMEIIKRIGEASESVARTAHTIMKEVEFLTAKTQEEFGECSYLSHCS